MTASILMIVFKVFLVFVILLAMILILLGIGKLFSHENKLEQDFTDSLRKELEMADKVISQHSLFRSFLLNRESGKTPDMDSKLKAEKEKNLSEDYFDEGAAK